LFFQSNTLTGQSIEIEIVDPELNRSSRMAMTYVDDGLYYCDVVFTQRGSHSMRILKGIEKVGHGILPVGDSGGIVTKVPNTGHK
jgi:hypothetical protein